MLYFPWGVVGKGYVMPSQRDYERLHRDLKIYQLVSLIVIIALAAMGWLLGCIIAAVVLVGLYAIWALYQTRGLAPSDEKMSMRENMVTQARLHGARGLWILEIISLVFVASGVAMLAIDFSQWLAALGAIVFFGGCAIVFARMLRMQRQGA